MRFATYMWIIVIWFGLRPAAGSAQTFEDGYQSYVRNQFPVAELQFKGALKKARTDEDKAFILKFIGICQYMRGDKKSASGSFVQSVRMDSNVQIDEEEVLDPSVVPFFNSIKNRVGSEPKKKVAADPPPPPKPTPKPAPKKVAKSSSKSKSKSKSLASDSIMTLPDDSLIEEKPERKGRINFLHFLPFGVGQFVNGSPLLGSAFAAGEIGALYLMFDADKTIKEREGLNDLVANREGLNDQQREDFYKENNAFIATVKNQKNLALVGFVAIWAAGATEAVLNSPDRKRSSYEIRPEEHNGQASWVFQWKKEF